MTNGTWRVPTPERDEILQHLTGAGKQAPRPAAITEEPGGGGKFAPDGSVLPYPGNTFLCHLDPQGPFFAAVSAVQDRLRASRFARYFTLLPKPSFHMTVFCGVSGVVLDSEGWPEGVPPGVGLQDINRLFEERLSQLSGPTGFSVRPRSLYPNSIRMCATSAPDEAKLRDMRDRLADVTGLHRSGHDTYEFHVSMGYLLRWMPEDDAEALLVDSEQAFAEHLAGFERVDLGPVEFCDFTTMHHFRTRGWIDPVGYRTAGLEA